MDIDAPSAKKCPRFVGRFCHDVPKSERLWKLKHRHTGYCCWSFGLGLSGKGVVSFLCASKALRFVLSEKDRLQKVAGTAPTHSIPRPLLSKALKLVLPHSRSAPLSHVAHPALPSARCSVNTDRSRSASASRTCG